MRRWHSPHLPTVPDGPLGCFSLIAISYGVGIDKLSPHKKAAASVILHWYANSIFSKRQLREIVAIASNSRPLADSCGRWKACLSSWLMRSST